MKNHNWISCDTAVLVIHGIGHQKPLETEGKLARSLITSLDGAPSDYEVNHEVAQKPRSSKGFWYDNYLSIQKKDDRDFKLDIYEYYWANQTQDLTSTEDIHRWIRGVAKGAATFYERNKDLLKKEKRSFFTKNGKPRLIRYRLFLWISSGLIPSILKTTEWILKAAAKIPVAGWLVKGWLESVKEKQARSFRNVIGDIVVYNSLDAKSEFYEVRKAILDGAVSALRYLLEPSDKNPGTFRYGKVIIAGHSLGSQISFDALNRLNHHINQGNIPGYTSKGKVDTMTMSDEGDITDRLGGLVTFGSPLDKIAFFLWEQADKNQYLRARMLKNFHSFKQRKDLWKYLDIENQNAIPVGSPFSPLLDDIPWYNFYDRRDYVSGHLDFYNPEKVENFDRNYKSRFYQFTHSWYWDDISMFGKIFRDLIR